MVSHNVPRDVRPSDISCWALNMRGAQGVKDKDRDAKSLQNPSFNTMSFFYVKCPLKMNMWYTNSFLKRKTWYTNALMDALAFSWPLLPLGSATLRSGTVSWSRTNRGPKVFPGHSRCWVCACRLPVNLWHTTRRRLRPLHPAFTWPYIELWENSALPGRGPTCPDVLESKVWVTAVLEPQSCDMETFT